MIPEYIYTADGYFFMAEEAICVLLWRLSYPNRWSFAIPLFGRSIAVLSQITHFLLIHLLAQFTHLLTGIPHYYRDPINLRRFADAVVAKGLN